MVVIEIITIVVPSLGVTIVAVVTRLVGHLLQSQRSNQPLCSLSSGYLLLFWCPFGRGVGVFVSVGIPLTSRRWSFFLAPHFALRGQNVKLLLEPRGVFGVDQEFQVPGSEFVGIGFLGSCDC